MGHQRDLTDSTKDEIRSGVASTVQYASIRDNNLMRVEQRALKQLKHDNDIVILPADKGHVTVVMDKTDYNHKMDTLVNETQCHHFNANSTAKCSLCMTKANMIDLQTDYRLRSSVGRPLKLQYGVPKLHKPQIPMRPIVSFSSWVAYTYELSKHLATMLQLLTNKSQHKLQSTENFIDAMKTVQISDDYKL